MRICTTILSLLLVPLLFGFASAESFWPMFQQNPGHTGVAPVSTTAELELLWATNGNTVSSSHLVLGCDGSLWAIGSSVDRLSPRGEVISHISLLDIGIIGSFKGQGSPAVLADGTLIVMAGVRNEDKMFVPTLYAIEPNENVRWTLPFEGQAAAHSLITLAPDGQIYVGCPTCLYSVTQEGGITWSYDCDDQISTIPAVANDGSVYFGTRNSTLYCMSPDGLLDWTFRPEGTASWIDSAPTLDYNERVYFTVSKNGLYCLNSDGSVEFSYPIQKSCYTSPILMPDGSIVFYERAEAGPQITRLNADGTMRWATPLPTSQMPLSSPAADQDGNVFVSIHDTWDPGTGERYYQFARVDSDGVFTPLYTEIGGGGRAGGPCIGADGTIYCHVGSKIMAFGKRRDRSIAIITDSPGYAAWLAFCVNVSVIITNAEIGTPLDCYIAYKAADSDELLFYPFWSPDPTLAAMQFRPLPGGAFFEKIEIAHLSFDRLPAGDYQLFAGLFAPGTFNAVGPIAFCTFSVVGSPIPTETRDCTKPSNAMAQNTFDTGQVGTPPTISIRTNKDGYVSGEVLDLSISFANEGLGVGYDLYIAAILDDDPEGKLFFFPTWSNDRMLNVISFQPMAQGASLPDWTIMHLELTDALPRGGYRFLAAFFHIGSFEFASEIAEAHWTLM